MGFLATAPPHDELRERLATLICQIDFSDLIEKNLSYGVWAFLEVSYQAQYLSDTDTSSWLEKQLTVVVAQTTKALTEKSEIHALEDESFAHWETLEDLLIESALNIAIATSAPDNIAAKFAELLSQFVQTDALVTPHFTRVIQRLCEDLSPTEARHFWPLFIRIRAR